MSDKILDIGKFRELKISGPDDLRLLTFIFKKYLKVEKGEKDEKNKAFIEKLFEEAGKDEEGDNAFMLIESLKLAEKGMKLDNDLNVFISRNDLLEKVIKWLGLEKDKLKEEYNLQASAMGIKGKPKKEIQTTPARILKFTQDRN